MSVEVTVGTHMCPLDLTVIRHDPILAMVGAHVGPPWGLCCPLPTVGSQNRMNARNTPLESLDPGLPNGLLPSLQLSNGQKLRVNKVVWGLLLFVLQGGFMMLSAAMGCLPTPG